MNDSTYLHRCIELARQGGRSVMPNPMVGSVIVCDDAIIGEGYHANYGGSHAEVHAIESVRDTSLLARSTLYVSLEPCSHFGKTPPCADLIISSKIPHVVVGCEDPNPKVAGEGIARLRQAGIQVDVGVLRDECIALNRRFILSHREKRPYIILKWAQTKDGFVARSDYSSKWISSEASRKLVHTWRAEEMGILVGATTATMDDPRLTVRNALGPDPLRILIDPHLRVPPASHLLAEPPETWVFSYHLREANASTRYIQLPPEQDLLSGVLSFLYSERILSLFIEGGATTLQSFIDAGMWDEMRIFTSSKSFEDGIAAPTCSEIEVSNSLVPDSSGEPDQLRIFAHPNLSVRLGMESLEKIIPEIEIAGRVPNRFAE